MNRPVILAALLLWAFFTGEAQEVRFYGDTVILINPKIQDMGAEQNSKLCLIEKDKFSYFYTPEEIASYKLRSGKQYVSRIIQGNKRVFLELLSGGVLNLYYYPGPDGPEYYLESSVHGSPELIRLSPDFIKNPPELLTHFPVIIRNLPYAYYNRKFMVKMTELVNHDLYKPVNFTRYGFQVGKSANIPVYANAMQRKELKAMQFEHKSVPLGGIFYESAITRNTSFRLELRYSEEEFTGSSLVPQLDMTPSFHDVTISTNMLEVPLLFRYYYLSSFKYKLFISAGASYSFDLNYNYDYYRSDYIFGTYEMYDLNLPQLESKGRLGYNGGTGVTAEILYRCWAFVEFRYNRSYNLKKDAFGMNGISVVAGISF